MNKNHSVIGLLLSAAIFSSSYAGGYVDKTCSTCPVLFAGIFYTHWWPDTIVDFVNGHSDMVKNYSGIGAEIGKRYGSWFGVAGGLEHYFEKQKTVVVVQNNVPGSVVIKTRSNLFYLEALGFYSLQRLNLIGALGVSILDVGGLSVLGVPNNIGNAVEVNPRIGAGAEFPFRNQVSVKGMVHWSPSNIRANRGLGYNSFTTASIGVFKQFA